MLKKTKRFASLFLAFAIMLSLFTFSPIVFAADGDEEEVTDTAFLMYADKDWKYQYWGDPLVAPEPTDEDPDPAFHDVIIDTDTVTGTGEYTVGLDFTTEDDDERTLGFATGVSFMAVGIDRGEENFPGYCIKITEIRINGEPITMTGKGYTSSDMVTAEGDPDVGKHITTRMNIYNEWVSSVDTVSDLTVRSYDRDLTDVAPIIVDKEDFVTKTVTSTDPETEEEVAEEVAVEIKTLEVDFIYLSGEETVDTAYIMFADADGSVQYWGSDVPGVVADNEFLLGDPEGQYTVSLDFSGTNEEGTGFAEGVTFTALGIKEGEQTMPGHFIQIDSIKINGEPIAYIKGYTSSDDEIETRMNIYNEWVSELPEDARTPDGKTADAQPIIVNATDFAEVNTYEITFTIIAPEVEDTAYLGYADANWACQYLGKDINAEPVEEGEEPPAPNPVVTTKATVTGEGTYTVGLDFTAYEGDVEKEFAAGHATGVAFAAVMIKTGEETFGGYKIKIESITVNGEEIEFTKGYTSSDDKVETRMNIYNEWVTSNSIDPASDFSLRSYDSTFTDASPIIVDKEVLAEVETIAVVFTLIHGVSRVEPPDDFDYEGALELDYNAYFCIQTGNYIFRNAWDDAQYGIDKSNYTHLTGWDADDNEVDYGGTFTDVTGISDNGTFTVSCTLGEMGLGTDTSLRQLFVSTNINSKMFKKSKLSITKATVKIGDQDTKNIEEVFVATKGTYAQIVLLSEYETAVGTEPFAYTIPTAGQTITITFTIEGFPEDVPPVIDDDDDDDDEDEVPTKKKGCKNSKASILFVAIAAYVSVMLIKKRG